MYALNHQKESDWQGAGKLIRDTDFSSPFETGIEYSSPARGPWNIVHTGMLLPESHQIFICAQSCLRGVVLTAAEMNAFKRFSTIAIEEHNILDGDTEDLIINGTEDILNRLPYKPKAVLIFTSCIHHFIGCDLRFVYDQLKKKFPEIDITDCYMNPTMRKTLTAPDVKMRQQLYSTLHEAAEKDDGINFIGNNFAADSECEIILTAIQNGLFTRDICNTKTYSEFQEMASSWLNIVTNPAAELAGKTLEKRFDSKYIYLPVCWSFSEIQKHFECYVNELKKYLDEKNISFKNFNLEELQRRAEDALIETKKIFQDTPVVIDYTAVTRPLGLARLLLSYGINVVSVYADSFTAEEKNDFDFLKNNFPNLMLYATVHPKMAILPAVEKKNATKKQRIVAVGQKATYFTGTNNFVNILENGGLWGFTGIIKLCELLQDAFVNEKDAAKIIQVKGWGCCA